MLSSPSFIIGHSSPSIVYQYIPFKCFGHRHTASVQPQELFHSCTLPGIQVFLFTVPFSRSFFCSELVGVVQGWMWMCSLVHALSFFLCFFALSLVLALSFFMWVFALSSITHTWQCIWRVWLLCSSRAGAIIFTIFPILDLKTLCSFDLVKPDPTSQGEQTFCLFRQTFLCLHQSFLWHVNEQYPTQQQPLQITISLSMPCLAPHDSQFWVALSCLRLIFDFSIDILLSVLCCLSLQECNVGAYDAWLVYCTLLCLWLQEWYIFSGNFWKIRILLGYHQKFPLVDMVSYTK